MTPEEAAYHRVMLLAGLRDGYDLALDSALENENPLSGLIVNLAFCVPDTEKTISVLYNYILDNPPDDRRVFSLVMEDFRNRYLSKSMTEVQICDKMCDVVNKLGKGLDEPWYELVVLSDDCDLMKDGVISAEAFCERFEAYLLRGESLNVWELQNSCSLKQQKRSKAYRRYLIGAVISLVLAFSAIFVAGFLTDQREIYQFSKDDWLIWCAFLAVEAALLSLAVFLALQCGKLWNQRGTVQRFVIEKHKSNGLQQYPQYEKVFYEYQDGRRAIVFRRDDGYAVIMEQFDFNHLLWRYIGEESSLDSMEAVEEYLFDVFDEQEFSAD